MAKRSVAEVATGLAVLAVAAGFAVYAAVNTGQGGGGGMQLFARFDNIGTLAPGADVRISGVPVGRVTGTRIDPSTFQAVVSFTVPEDLKLPTDTSAQVGTNGLLGSPVLSLAPGGSETNLKAGGTITITQGTMDLEDLLGKFIFNVGSLADATQKMLKANGAAPGAGPGGAPGALPGAAAGNSPGSASPGTP